MKEELSAKVIELQKLKVEFQSLLKQIEMYKNALMSMNGGL